MTSISIAVPQTAVTLDLDTVIAAVSKAGYTVTLTPPVVVVPPVVVPPVVAPPVATPAALALAVVFAQNGAVNPAWIQDYSYNAVDARLDKTIGGNGNPYGIKVTTTGPWGGFQPSNTNGGVTDCSKGKIVTVDVDAPKGRSYSMQFLKGGDTPINAPGFTFTKTVDGWERFQCPKAQVMSDNGVDVSAIIYKGAVQSKLGAAGDVYEVDNWGCI